MDNEQVELAHSSTGQPCCEAWYRCYGLTAPLVVGFLSFLTLFTLDAWLRTQHAKQGFPYGIGGLSSGERDGFQRAIATWYPYVGTRGVVVTHAIVDSIAFVPAYLFALLISLMRGRRELAAWLDSPPPSSLLVWRRLGRPPVEEFVKSVAGKSKLDIPVRRRSDTMLFHATAAALALVVALVVADLVENMSEAVLAFAHWQVQSSASSGAEEWAHTLRIATLVKLWLLLPIGAVVSALWIHVIQSRAKLQSAPEVPPTPPKLPWYRILVYWAVGRATRQPTSVGDPSYVPQVTAPPESGPPVIGIACSGGGIRSASYNLGALQVLHQDQAIWPRARFISAVSGGGYIAAGYFVAQSKSPNPLPEPAPPATSSVVFAPGSPEERYLRNHSSYVSPNSRAKFDLALNILHGLSMNLFLLALWAIVVGRPLGWLYAANFFPELRDPENGIGRAPFNRWMWFLILAVVVACLSTIFWERAIARFRRPPESLLGFLRAWAWRLFSLSLAAALVLIILPNGVVVERWFVKNIVQLPKFKFGPINQATLAGLIPILTAVGGLLASAYRLVTAKKFSWLVRIAEYLLGPFILFAILTTTVSGAAAHGYSQREMRLWFVALAVAALLGWLSDANLWSMHQFYKERLSSAFVLYRPRVQEEASELPYDIPVFLSKTQPPEWPTLVMCAAVNVGDEGVTPPGRRASLFSFDHEYASAPFIKGMAMRMGDMEDRVPHGAMTLPAIVAMSGAALAPNMGKMTRPSLRFLMTLLNIRLGLWIPNPLRVDRLGARPPTRNTVVWLWQRIYDRGGGPGPLYLAYEALGLTHVGRRYLFVTDGGHFDNLGLVELLRRGCTRIYCFDASGDALDTYNTLGEAIALARSELEVEIAIDPTPLLPNKQADAFDPCKEPPRKGPLNPCEDKSVFSGDDHVIGTIKYPNGVLGDLVFCKAAIVREAPWDVLAYRERDPVFPCHPTSDQLYTDERFEAYRRLGAFTACRAIAKLTQTIADRGGDPLPTEFPNC